MKVKSLFCFPLVKNDIVIGLLFGGSTEREINKTAIYDKLSLCASLMTNHLNTEKLQKELKKQTIEISVFREIIKVLTTIKDLNKTLHILMDINMNFTRAAFTSIVYKRSFDSDHIEVVSRGLSEQEINDYCIEAAERVFSDDFESEKSFGKSSISEIACGVTVMEFPLVFDDELYGLLSVGISSDTDFEKYASVISSLATAGGMSIHFLGKKEKDKNKTNLIELIQNL